MKNLASDFKKRSLWINNRASCVFPIFLNNLIDTHLVFQNYWSWKNNIEEVFCILRIRSPIGESILTTPINIENHNEIKISNLVTKTNEVHGGSAEIEIISPENLGYPFPAILCFYVTKKQKSVVHAAGRILNTNESFNNENWKETNFTVSMKQDFDPVICLFYGQLTKANSSIKIEFKNNHNNTTLLKKSFLLKTTPFCSKVLFIKDLLNSEELLLIKDKKIYIIFETEIKGIFGRFVVGNFHEPSNQFFSTHSYQFIDPHSSDRVSSSKNESSTFLPVFNKRPLKVNIISFPTNINENLNLNISKAKINETLKPTNESLRIQTGGIDASVFEYQLHDDGLIKLESFRDAPSRINVNYNFSLENSIFPSDLATGFKAKVYPPKSNHWGSSILEKDWKTIIFIRNLNHKNNSKKAVCNFEAFTNNNNLKKQIIVLGESCNFIELSYSDFKKRTSNYFSWKIYSKETTLEVFWISYNKLTGAICAEHSF